MKKFTIYQAMTCKGDENQIMVQNCLQQCARSSAVIVVNYS